MSLNRSEQLVFDYLQQQPEELHYWQEKVRAWARREADDHAIAVELDRALWAYFEERAGVAAPFIEHARREGLRRTSMRNLAELVLRLWVEPRPKPKNVADAPARE